MVSKSICAAVLVGLLSTGAASASTITGFLDDAELFKIFFKDDNGNGKLEQSEFTGWEDTTGTSVSFRFLAGIGGLPSIFDIATPGGDCFSTKVTFCFSDGGNALYSYNDSPRFAYSTDATPSAVPLPASILFLIGGLAGLVGLGRRRKKLA